MKPAAMTANKWMDTDRDMHRRPQGSRESQRLDSKSVPTPKIFVLPMVTFVSALPSIYIISPAFSVTSSFSLAGGGAGRRAGGKEDHEHSHNVCPYYPLA